ncbi:50S ribosomal protein L4, partial [Candidatus Bathyarchaeota archaeon]
MENVLPVYDLEGKVIEKTEIPKVFFTPVRPDLVKRAVLAIQSLRFQPQGRDPLAGKRTTAESRGVGLGIARIPRVKGAGTPRAGQGGFAPGTVGGRLAHP